MKYIKLTKGYKAMVDNKDFDRVSKHKWHICPDGRKKLYAKTNIDRKTVKMHRFILRLKPKDNVFADHINGNGLDNRRCNLRRTTNQENQFNKGKYKGTSRYKGVSLDSKSKKWVAQIRCDDKVYRLGRFDVEIDAARAYDNAARKHFGKFAFLNNV